ncbi:MAG: HigA family addiction module antitoxin [Pseudomonadota bacterium]|nr:HigA family addiction module antitoxin [Pseudomonadota bacterium]
MLFTEFMEPLGLDGEALAAAIDVPAADLAVVLGGRRAMTGELDLRLTRYFRMSEGFFLRLQIQHELLEAKRALNGELDRIVPRTA